MECLDLGISKSVDEDLDDDIPDGGDREQQVQSKKTLPCCLNIENANAMSPYLSLVPEGDWGMFCDDQGRVIAQQTDLVLTKDSDDEDDDSIDPDNTEVSASSCDAKESGDPETLPVGKYPAQHNQTSSTLLLVSVTTHDEEEGEEVSTPSEMPGELFSDDLDVSDDKLTTSEDNRPVVSESTFKVPFDVFEKVKFTERTHFDSYIENKGDAVSLPTQSLDLGGFPCIKNVWYSTKPKQRGVLVDDFTTINTSVLAKDVRRFLKQLSITLKDFAKHQLNRTQGTLSDLLNHPKEWRNLSGRGKETYIKMIEFLSSKNLKELVTRLRTGCIPPADRLPVTILEPLLNNRMPADADIESAALSLSLHPTYLRRHCADQLQSFLAEDKGICTTDSGEMLFPKDDLAKTDDGTQTVLSPSSYLKADEEAGLKSSQRYICPCLGCGAVLHTKPSFDSHVRHHTGTELHRCAVCERSFSTKSNLKSHMKVHERTLYTHKISKRAKERMMTEENETEDLCKSLTLTKHKKELLSQMKYICGVCWEGFKTRQKLCKHLLLQHKVSRDNLLTGYTCYVCGKSLRNITALLIHMRTHTNYRPFECNQCKMSFHTKANLLRHIRTHTGEKPFSCPTCHACFTEAKSVTIHMRTHTGERPYACPVCNKCFAQRSPLQAHMLIHKDEKPHLCELCGQGFRQRPNLLAHAKRHSGLKQHKCSMCELSFLTRSDYQRHVLKHGGERPFKCEACKRSFTRLTYLREHLKKRQGPSAPKCQYCDKRFCDDNTRRKHTKTHANAGSIDAKMQPTSVFGSQISIVDKAPDPSTTSDSSSTPVFVTAKTMFNNGKHYIITAVPSLENVHDKCLDDGESQSNLPPAGHIMLASCNQNSLVTPFSTAGHSLILQGVDLSGQHISVAGSRMPGLVPHHGIMFTDDTIVPSTSVNERSVPISFETDDVDCVKNRNNKMVEDSDPYMQSVVVETEDSIIISRDQGMPAETDKHLKLSDAISAYQVIVPSNSGDNNIIIAMNDDHNVDMVDADLHSEHTVSDTNLLGNPIGNQQSMVSHHQDDVKGQTYIVVDLEPE